MKSEKGVTLASLAIYIVLIFIVLAILATVTSNFQSSIKEINQEGTEIAEINKFNMYFLQEVKKQGNKITSISDTEITFSTGKTYSFLNYAICLIEKNSDGTDKTIKLAEDIENCKFSKSSVDGKTVVTVTIKAKNTDAMTQEYVLNNEEITSTYEDEEAYVYNSNTTNQTENNM